MTTVSSMNVVLQQGTGAKEVHNARHQAMDYAQAAETQIQKAKEAEERTTVNPQEEKEKVKLDQDQAEDKQRERENKKQHRESRDNLPEKPPGETGRLLDTVA